MAWFLVTTWKEKTFKSIRALDSFSTSLWDFYFLFFIFYGFFFRVLFFFFFLFSFLMLHVEFLLKLDCLHWSLCRQVKYNEWSFNSFGNRNEIFPLIFNFFSPLWHSLNIIGYIYDDFLNKFCWMVSNPKPPNVVPPKKEKKKKKQNHTH